MSNFYDLGLSPQTIKALNNMGFEQTTPIQDQAIPVAVAGKDIIGQAQTGTGKTAAFGIPLIEKAELNEDKIQAIVLTPTRELAIQVAEELNKIGQFKGVRALPIYGGQDITRQIKSLKKHPHIIVATPGRFMDHMRRKTIRTQSIKMVVLDEADEMLNMGFIEDIETILKEIPKERQTLLFSATMPKQIQKLAQQFMHNPEMVAVKSKEVTVPNIEQEYIELPEKQKFDVLCRLIDIHSPELAIVFGRTKRRVDELAEALNKRGYDAEGIHGDLTQAKRDSVIRKFKDGTIEVLVATDVAARGLDVSGVTHVYNFDVPQDPESYVHRVGRTGRAGKTGLAVTFVTPREIDHLRNIEAVSKRKLVRKPVPTFAEALEGQQKMAVDKLIETVKEGEVQHYKATAEQLLEDYDSISIVAAALKLIVREPDTTPVTLTAEAPLRVKKVRGDFSKNRSSRGKQGGGHGGDRGRSPRGKQGEGRGDRGRGRREQEGRQNTNAEGFKRRKNNKNK